jgi:peptidoglycan L-alanyl-D-glutamate endopeptidase CwlK
LEDKVTLDEMIRAVQAKLNVEADGRPGTQTWGAIYAAIVKPKIDGVTPEQAIDEVDPRSEKNIAMLLPEVQPLARALVQKAKAVGIQIKVLSGLRTYEEQDDLYAKGRTAPGPIVTKVKGGYSNHNFGIAFDVGVFEGSKYLTDSPKYKAVGALGMDLGLDWGGTWKTFRDEPHFQLRPSWAQDMSERDMVAELRERHADGTAVYA